MLDVVGRAEEIVAGIRLELRRIGRGRPLLLLHSEDALECEPPFLDLLVADHEVIIPSPPGFGRSERPDWVSAPDDIAYVYLELIERLKLGGIDVLGCSLGGWIALEMATKEPAVFSRTALVAPYGAKFLGPAERDIADIWMLPPAEVTKRKWFDPKKGERDYKAMPEDKLSIIARNNESFARFCWEPYMHNPKLKHRLARVRAETLFIWGENDGIVTPAYGRIFADHVPGASFATIAEAGHYPHIEQPVQFMRHLRGFLV
jgi:pimeloyl-ACP methyl ester carboxylesterase